MKVLIVDDNELMTEMLDLVLESEGLETERAYDTDQAIKKLREGEYQLLITDIVMPGAGGVWLIDHIQEHYPDMRVIAMSGYNPAELGLFAGRLPRNRFWEKGSGIEELLAMVRESVNQRN